MQGPDERAWVEEALADYDNLRAAFLQARADRDWDLAVRLVAAVPELVHLRIGYEASGWAERLLDDVDPDHPRYVGGGGGRRPGCLEPRRVRAGRGPGAAGGRPAAATGDRRASPTRGTSSRTSPLYEGDVDRALRHYTAEAGTCPRRRGPGPAGLDPLLRRGLPGGTPGTAAGARAGGGEPRRG